MTVGLVICWVEGDERTEDVSQRLKTALEHVPSGRMLAVCFPLPKTWAQSTPFEDIVSRTLLRDPASRKPDDDVQFFGNVCVRGCSNPSLEQRMTEAEIGIALFRRSGEKVYRRAKTASEALLDDARIPTLHPVFTRDAANNVWHLDVASLVDSTNSRLASLLSWPDERVVVSSASGEHDWSGLRGHFDSDLIGVAQKVHYDWFPTQLALSVPQSDSSGEP